MQAHTLGEVGNLGTFSLRVSSGTILPIFIEIGSYLTDKEQKISWHSFFETQCRLWFTRPHAASPVTSQGLRRVIRSVHWGEFETNVLPLSQTAARFMSVYVLKTAQFINTVQG